MRTLVEWLRAHAHPKVVLPVAVGLGLLVYVASLASAPRNAAELWSALRQIWWIALLLTIPYLAARLYVWNDLMQQLGIHVPFRRVLVAFAGGEVTKSIPGGIYVENYLLLRVRHLNEEETIRSSTATTAMLGLESAIALTVVLILGLPGQAWVRWALVGIVCVWLMILGLLWMLLHRWAHRQKALPGWLCHATLDGEKFLDAGLKLVTLRTAVDIIPTTIYMFVYSIDLYFITRTLPVKNLGWLAIITVYTVMVLAVVLVPIPTEIGISEISAVGSLTAFGVDHHEAAVVALALRILATGATILVSGVVFLLFKGELDRARQEEERLAANKISAGNVSSDQAAGSEDRESG